jgi:hypothetical protein
MRPKASRENLHIAVSFASAITIHRIDAQISRSNDFVECKGPASIYAALRIALPDIVRDSEHSVGRKKNTLSETELIKFLCRSGYIKYRYRQRVRGTTNEWRTGSPRFKNIRWANPRNSEDMRLMDERLNGLAARLPITSTICRSRLITFLSSVTSDINSDVANREDLISKEYLDILQETDPYVLSVSSPPDGFTSEFVLPNGDSALIHLASENGLSGYSAQPGPFNMNCPRDHGSFSACYQHASIPPLCLTQYHR